MYSVITLKDDQINMHWANSQSECYNIIEKIQTKKYKIYHPNFQKNLFFLSALEWDDLTSNFILNINKAKEIKKKQFRQIRQVLFQKLDIAFIKAIELNDDNKKQYIISLKDQLRNITDISLPDSENDLIDFIPEVFKEIYILSI
jgi:hypothetical protein